MHIVVCDLSYRYTNRQSLFEAIRFSVPPGGKAAIVGNNGTGKSTLLKLLAGELTPVSGSVACAARPCYVPQQPDLTGLSVAEALGAAEKIAALRAICAGSTDPVHYDTLGDDWEIEAKCRAALDGWGLHRVGPDTPADTLSGGERTKLLLAGASLRKPEILLLDEPTNHLDLDSVIWLQDFLRSYKGAVLVVTHDRYFLDQVTNHIWELSFGHLYHYEGNYQDFVAKKAERVELAQETEKKNQQLYKKELAWMRTGAKARSTKQKGRINRFHELEGKVGNLQTDQDISINLGSQRLGKDVIKFQNANLTLGDHRILDDFNWLVQAGDRIGITGENGAGKTSLLNVIAQRVPLDSGVLKIGETVKLGYYTQQTEGIDDSKRMISFLSEIAENVTDKDGNKLSVTQLLERFLFPRFMHGTLIRKLSGGEKRRLYLLKILMQQPNVLLLDEPTNDLDIGTLTVLEDYLDNFAGTVITVSHDRYFLDKVADDLLIFHGNGQIQRYTGRFTDYLKEEQAAKEAQQTAKAAAKKSQPAEKPASAAPKKKTKLTYAEQLEWDHIDDDLDALDQQRQDLEQQMAAAASDYTKLADLQKQLNAVQKQIDEKTARWEYLSNFVDE